MLKTEKERKRGRCLTRKKIGRGRVTMSWLSRSNVVLLRFVLKLFIFVFLTLLLTVFVRDFVPELIWDCNERKFLCAINHEILCQATQVHSCQRRPEQELGNKVSIRHCMHRVVRRRCKTQVTCQTISVDVERISCNSSWSQRTNVSPAQEWAQSEEVLMKHPCITQEPMRPKDRLSSLQVSVSCNDNVLFPEDDKVKSDTHTSGSECIMHV
jgi:hypothetical protein